MGYVKVTKHKSFPSRYRTQEIVEEIAQQIKRDYNEPVLLISVVNGTFSLTISVMKELTILGATPEVYFVYPLAQYVDKDTGEMQEVIGPNMDVSGKNVVILESFMDTGERLGHLIKEIQSKGAKSLEVCAFYMSFITKVF